MTALRQRVELYSRFGMKVLATADTNLDIDDKQMLRDQLELMVKEHKGDLHRDLSDFRIRVRDISRSGSPSTIRCWCNVTPAGRTVVQR